MTYKAPSSTFEERWVGYAFAALGRWPGWLRIVVVVWLLLSLAFVFVDELHTNVPSWFSWLMTAPYIALVFFVLVPAVLGIWLRWLSWPFRLVARLLRTK